MCGITGFWDTSCQKSALQMQAIAQKMSNTLLHRGPDDGGVWVDAASGIGFGHRRLAIVDLSPEGHQPMVSANGRYVIVFNGEIYNFLELRRELERLGHRFRGRSDTEVMLAAFSEWDVEPAVKRFNGMFAFALWDWQERVLHLGRDKLGEKPLYYGWINGTFLFASELKAIKAYPNFEAEINRDALALFMRHNYIPAPYSVYKGIYKLPPGTLLSWNGGATRSPTVPYWSAKEVAESGIANPFTGSKSEAVEQLEALLQQAVHLRMVADVPLGAFLSGGIDSSTVVALMQQVSSQQVKTFTIGFDEDAFNEAAYAKAVAKHLGTDHTELYVTPEEALAVIPKLPMLYDEPFSDSSQIPTFLVSQLARQQVTVALSGDGGDELFAGYNRYFWGAKIWQQIGWIPPSLRQVAASALTRLSPQAWDRGFTHFDSLLPARLQQRHPGDKLHKLAEILAVSHPDAMYKGLVSHWKNPEAVVIGSCEPPTILSDAYGSDSALRQHWTRLPSFIQRMMYLDTVTYLPDDILTKVDRASMGVGLEARVPLLDHRLVEFAWRVPLSMKIQNKQGKWLLRQVLCKYVPSNLIERPKMGFGVPIKRWLRGSLRDWAEELLSEQRLRDEGFFNPQPIRQKWKEHLAGDRNWQYYLWDVLMFQAWLDA
ncbi:asparagine synthase (glutamine-hydrolyzing) [Trichocoleus sp. DQ-A3]|uniref:asparagine synthase (glutamine-hydrolyzing) n=1 Tax=Cyanophyceae TaxID=3028117 RepID=UPI0016847367|nr:asparagine synthase (glutamine-hydrolyzing) [Coleofasciculus sp. FACHB-125]MBD1903534.1 asparagine synthase (glutamine-hydrolyzing) [Coleofasciculus sp. FACHB-125]MBD2087555.1 asparagine synthase (glutamine-hydrolyzing) [Coleofasciculus sp. FACHB-542]